VTEDWKITHNINRIMKIICVDETGIPKTGFFGIAAVMVDATKYPLLAAHFEKVLAAENWRPDYEFKGKAVFSQKSGDPDVLVERRVEMVTQLFDEFRSKSNSRLTAVLAWNTAGDNVENYRHLLGHALRMLKLPKEAGKNLVVVVCDQWDKIKFDDLSSEIRRAITDLGGRIVEDVCTLSSRPRHAGLSITDLLAYFLGWQSKKDESEIFPGSKLPEKNARIAEWCESIQTVSAKEFPPGTPFKEAAKKLKTTTKSS
jgi:hypothetical protein